jgi:transcriptional regulator with XRE-family HTH domain
MINKGILTGSFIRTRRIELGLTQKQLSQKLNWRINNTQYVSNCERGLNPFPVKRVYMLSLALQVSPEIIIGKMLEDYSNSIRKELNK